MKQGTLFILLLISLSMLSCQSGQEKGIKYKEYASSDSSYIVSVPEQIPAKKCVADFMSFVKDDIFIIIQRVSVDYLSDDITKINEESGKFSFSQIEVSDTSILYQASKGFITAYRYYLIKKMPTANYMISVSSLNESRTGIKEMGHRIYESLKPFHSKDVDTKNKSVLLKADKTFSNQYYSIKYPKKCMVIESIDEETDAYIVSEKDGFALMIMRFETDIPLAEGNALGNENIQQAGARILEEKLITLNGVKCYRAIQEIPSQSSGYEKLISYSFKKKNMFYNIRIGNLSTKEKEKLAKEIINSFRFK